MKFDELNVNENRFISAPTGAMYSRRMRSISLTTLSLRLYMLVLVE